MKNNDPFSNNELILNWTRKDIEQRFGFSGGKYTTVNNLFTAIMALLIAGGFYSVLIFGLRDVPQAKPFCDMFLERGLPTYFIVFFFAWSLSIMFIKWLKLKEQRRALGIKPVPIDPDFVLNRETAKEVLLRLRSIADDTRNYVLLNRVDRALSNLQNIGRIGDVSEILKTQAEYDENQFSSSYTMVSGFLWATPVFGFVGTVLGLSVAVRGFGGTLQGASDIGSLKGALTTVTGGLGIAFETTLVALICALATQLILSAMQLRESEFLDECNDYCHSHIISKLKLTE
jgi:biopolymer transport protein ExbB/TolQ